MSTSSHSDPLIRALARLPVVQPNADRSEAVRVRARAMFEARTGSVPLASLEPAAVGMACAAYGWQLAKLAALLAR